MKHENILDHSYNPTNHFSLEKGEELIWQGHPRRDFSLSVVDLFWRNTEVTAAIIFEFITIFFTAKFLYAGDFNGEWFPWLLGCWTAIFIAEFLTFYRKQKTSYFLTNHRVAIQTWWMFKNRLYELPLHKIGEVKYSAYNDGYGMIYLIVKWAVPFKTRDFYSGSKRVYPTLELVKDCVEISNLITTQIRLRDIETNTLPPKMT